MAQYKAAMERIFRSEKDLNLETSGGTVEVGFGIKEQENLREINYPQLRWYSELTLNMLPFFWCFAFVAILDRDSMLSLWFMPFIGIFSATLANSIPVGGGIVFVPALMMLGVNLKLGAAFTVATMTFGNGVFGFLNWFKKDPTIFVWKSFKFTVPSAWLGATIGILYPILSETQCKYLFGTFSCFVAIIAVRAARNGGVVEPFFYSANKNPEITESQGILNESLLKLSFPAFFAGLILVSNIGIGNALTTFFTLTLFYGVEAKRAMVTGIITGGWTSLVPFLIHLIWLQDVPITRWLMVLPGIYLGAKIAPKVHSILGLEQVLYIFGVFLIATSLLMFGMA